MAQHEAAEVRGADSAPEPRRRLLANRLVAAAAIAMASLPVAAPVVVCSWLAAALLFAHVESRPRYGRLGPLLTVLSSLNYAIAAALLWSSDHALGRLLGVVIVMLNLLWLIMQYHARPKVFFAAAAPMILLAIVGALQVALTSLGGDQPWLALTALGTPALIVHYMLGARANLARSQAALARARAQAEERGVAAEAAARAKRFFLDTMSHEIRTPLNGVLGMVQAMEAERLSSSQRERLKVVRESGRALASILEDVLDLSSIEAGQLRLQATDFDLAELVQATAGAIALEARAKGLRLQVEIEPSAAGTYRGDPRRIRQILAKLLSNAVKFTDEGEVALIASRGADEALRIQVRDTGEGIPGKQLGRLFERFEQVDASPTRRHGGAGLGLSIAREFAQLMGGDVEVSSRLGKGSEFTLIAPLARVGEAAVPKPARARRVEPDLSQVRLLAAEDNPMNQLVLKTLLGQHGLDPIVVENGAEALAAWRREAFDVILMDVQMPEMDGPTAARAIRAEEAAKGLTRTPIIALTANAMPHQVEEYRAAGMDHHVAKPVEAGLLYDAIVEVLQRASHPAEAAA